MTILLEDEVDNISLSSEESRKFAQKRKSMEICEYPSHKTFDIEEDEQN